jgi:hypothetical protein
MVTLGESQGPWTEVLSGLGIGERIVATAAHCVNAIEATCAAEPGIKGFFDLPPLNGRAHPLLGGPR